jgi:hypothetical protein
MIKHNQDGSANSLLVSAILVILLIAALVFGVWSFKGRQDYKNNVDIKVAAAVTVAKQLESTAKDTQFAEAQKSPLKTYTGPQTYGSIVFQYPKSWSGYVDDTGNNSNALIDAYFSPNLVPSLTSTNSTFSLRVQVSSQSYSQYVQSLSRSNSSAPAISAYALPKVPGQIGIQLSGTLPDGKQGTMVVLPLRDKTLLIWTDSTQFLSDFNNYILANFNFAP